MKLCEGYFKVELIDLQYHYEHSTVEGSFVDILAAILDCDEFDISNINTPDTPKSLRDYIKKLVELNSYYGYTSVNIDTDSLATMFMNMTFSNSRITRCIDFFPCEKREIEDLLNKIYISNSVYYDNRVRRFFLNYRDDPKYIRSTTTYFRVKGADMARTPFEIEVIDLNEKDISKLKAHRYEGTIVDLLKIIMNIKEDNILMDNASGKKKGPHVISMDAFLDRAHSILENTDASKNLIDTLSRAFISSMVVGNKIVKCIGRTEGTGIEDILNYVGSLRIDIEAYAKIDNFESLRGLQAA